MLKFCFEQEKEKDIIRDTKGLAVNENDKKISLQTK